MARIEHVTDYAGHWRGEAWVTHHPYGRTVHRSLEDAERWVEVRAVWDDCPEDDYDARNEGGRDDGFPAADVHVGNYYESE